MQSPDTVHAALVAELDKWGSSAEAGLYPGEMWRYTLDYHAAEASDSAEVPEPSETCDAIPYIPPGLDQLDLAAQSRILDIGCLGGYGLYDVYRRRALSGEPVPDMVGIDISEGSVEMATAMGKHWAAGHTVEFKVMDARRLAFPDESFDLVIARLLMPYVLVREVLGEIARVMTNDAMAILQLHGFRYYLQGCRRSLSRPREFFYYARPILSGLCFAVSGGQPGLRLFRETALEPAGLERAARGAGLRPVWRGGFNVKPLVALRSVNPNAEPL